MVGTVLKEKLASPTNLPPKPQWSGERSPSKAAGVVYVPEGEQDTHPHTPNQASGPLQLHPTTAPTFSFIQ